MATGGITFSSAKDSLRTVVDNGVGVTDPRVMRRTNEATQELLAELIPVNGMMTVDIAVGADNFLLLPKELENAIVVDALDSSELVNGSSDVNQGWYSIVNPFTYVDPSMQHDNPLIDWFLVPDPDDPTILRRRYFYPGVTPGSIIRVTGAKRYLPITQDSDYLIIQNVPALKLMIQAIERREARNGITDAAAYKAAAVELLTAEVKKHLMDPNRALLRKALYQADLVNFRPGTLGHTRARIALEVPDMLMTGKSDITYLINQAVLEAKRQYDYLGRTERYSLSEGPNILPLTPAGDASDLLSYQEFEVLRLLVIAQRTAPTGVQPPMDAEPMRQQAFAMIERNLAAEVDAARLALHVEAVASNPIGSKAWMVGRIGLEVPEMIVYPIPRLGAIVDRAEERGMNMGIFKGMLEEFDAKVVSGNLILPDRVESVLAASLNGCPVEIRSIFFRYLENGPGAWDYSCAGRLDDQGEFTLRDGVRRRRYRVFANNGTSQPTNISSDGGTSSGGTGSTDFGGGSIQDGIFYFAGNQGRLVPITGGLALEIKDGSGNWIQQTTWTE